MGHNLWNNIQHLSWSARVDYVILLLIVVYTFRALFFPIVSKPWRVYYAITCAFSFIYLIYAVMLLAGTITVKDYRQFIGWVVVFLFLCLLWPSVLHKTENHVIQKKEREAYESN